MWWPWPMSKVEDGIYNFFFSPLTHARTWTDTRAMPSRSDRIYISLGVLSLIYRKTQFSTFLRASRNHFFFTRACFEKEKKITSYRQIKAHCTRMIGSFRYILWTIIGNKIPIANKSCDRNNNVTWYSKSLTKAFACMYMGFHI